MGVGVRLGGGAVLLIKNTSAVRDHIIRAAASDYSRGDVMLVT